MTDMEPQTLPKRTVTFCAVCALFLGSLYFFVATAYKNADALSHRPVPLELQDLVDQAEGR